MENNLTVTTKDFYAPIKNDWIAQSGLKESDFLKEVSFAVQHIHKSPYLQKADKNTVLRAVLNLAQVGLTLNPISKYAALVPRFNSSTRQVECVLEPMYQGLAKLLTDYGAVKSISCELIYEGDEILIDKASIEKVKKHTPYFLTGKDKGKIIAAYSLATLSDGSKHFEGMSYSEICEIRDRSESYKAYKDGKIKSCIWVSDEGEMSRKTVFKRHFKYLPKSEGHEKIQKAIELDNNINGFDDPVDFGMITWIENLIHNAKLEDNKKERFTKRMNDLEFKSDAYKLIEELTEYQPIIGLHRTPHTIEEQGEAIRGAVDRDDFAEQRKK
jgi:recombination protein RecT